MAVSVLAGGFENTDGENVFCLQGSKVSTFSKCFPGGEASERACNVHQPFPPPFWVVPKVCDKNSVHKDGKCTKNNCFF